MNILIACDLLDAVVVQFDVDFVHWLLGRHHDLSRCEAVPQIAAYFPREVLIQGIIFPEDSVFQFLVHKQPILVVDSIPGQRVQLEQLVLLLNLQDGSWRFQADYQGAPLKIEHCSFTSLELVKAILGK